MINRSEVSASTFNQGLETGGFVVSDEVKIELNVEGIRRIIRTVTSIVRGQATSDGAGVGLTRVIAQPDLPMLDPFLLLDDRLGRARRDYLAGFPAHPHRGFERCR